jgi:predicted DNA-binding transcriptional regulator YafY
MAGEKKKNRSVEPTVMEWSRYLVLDRCLRDKHRYYHMEDLVKAVNRMLERYDFYPVSDRTIKNDLKFMQSGEGFGAVLAKRYDGHTKIYTYENPRFSIMKLPMTDRESDLLKATIAMLSRFKGLPNYRWLEETLRMLRVKFNVSSKAASVSLDQNEKLRGLDDWFEWLFEACRKRLIVTMQYNRFDRLDKEPEERVVKPYQMRQYNNRWYLVGCEESKLPRLPMVVVPIDRIVGLNLESVEERDSREIAEGKYKVPSDAQIDEHFKDIVGVSWWPEGEVKTVKVKAWGLAMHYLDTKPIHPTQEVCEIDVDYKIFQWQVIPNEELVQALLVYADQMEVLEGDWVKEKLLERANAILKNNQKGIENEKNSEILQKSLP